MAKNSCIVVRMELHGQEAQWFVIDNKASLQGLLYGLAAKHWVAAVGDDPMPPTKSRAVAQFLRGRVGLTYHSASAVRQEALAQLVAAAQKQADRRRKRAEADSRR